jgi:hypothetical protein
MPVTTLDPKTALIVVDLQKGTGAFPKVHPMAVKSSTSCVGVGWAGG